MGASDSKSRNSNMSKLLDYGYNSYEMQTEVKKGEIVTKKKMLKAKDEELEIVTIEDASILVEKGEEKAALNYEIKLDNIKLPIKCGDKVGVLRLKEGNKIVNSTYLTVKKDVKKANIMELYIRNIKNILVGSI